MTLGIDAGVLALLVLVVLLGATMQGLVGLGLNLVSAPIVTMVTPSLMPELPLGGVPLHRPVAVPVKDNRDILP